ncbi:MAG TPA: permease [Candidatus Saccharimonadales bacterium]|nr:permease [Candidatus Saccharimonadales bacterium]
MHSILHALDIAGMMTWDILWSLLLGFLISAVIQSVVRKRTIAKLLGDNRPRTLVTATLLGIASSSCSYAAVAISRTLFRKGASFLAAMVFEIASTNLVVELGVITAILLGWQFTFAEFLGGPIMIIAVTVFFRIFLRQKILIAARLQAEAGVSGSMEGHAAMDMSIKAGGSLRRRLNSEEGLTSVSHIFIMELAAVWKDIVGGLLLAGAVAAWMPERIFKILFFAGHPAASRILGPVIGPMLAIITFVCSIGNIPLAATLWNDGISFGGVVSFIFADLIIIPILLIYRKYYGTAMTLFILIGFYVSMVIAGWLSEFIFSVLHLVPKNHHPLVTSSHVTLNYTTVLNAVFILAAGFLAYRFVRSGALPMLKQMD